MSSKGSVQIWTSVSRLEALEPQVGTVVEGHRLSIFAVLPMEKQVPNLWMKNIGKKLGLVEISLLRTEIATRYVVC